MPWIPGAVVTVVNVSNGVSTTKPTNEVGLYRFDYLDPGPYRLTVEALGFSKFVQENIVLQASADITVNAGLKAGDVKETVMVEASPVAVDVNSAGVTTTIDTKLANDIPRLDRNPFKLSLLNPAVLETRRQEMNPFQSLSASSLDLGGGASQRNDLLVDGSPISIGIKASYTPKKMPPPKPNTASENPSSRVIRRSFFLLVRTLDLLAGAGIRARGNAPKDRPGICRHFEEHLQGSL